MKNVNFQQAAQKTEGQAGGLRKRVGRAAEKGSLRPALMCSPLACPVAQPAGPPFCAAPQTTARGKFMFFIWQHGPPARPALRLVLSKPNYRNCKGVSTDNPHMTQCE